MPACTSCAATSAVEPPTEPAVCTRNSGLPVQPERVGQVQLGHHHALEEVGRLADHDRVDVVPGHAGVGQRPLRRLAHEPDHRHVASRGLVLGLSDADDGDSLFGHQFSPSSTHTRFCCRHGPLVAWATPRFTRPSAMRAATSPMRMSPAVSIGLAASAPPDGLTSASPSRSERRPQDHLLMAERRVQLGHVDRRRQPTPARSAASRVDALVGEVAQAEGHRFDAVVDAADPRRPVDPLARARRRRRARPRPRRR